jgi:hypothetical protein
VPRQKAAPDRGEPLLDRETAVDTALAVNRFKDFSR